MLLSHLLERTQCTPGMEYYTCSNGFYGCCSASNVCELSGCPDDGSIPTTTITLTTEGVAAKTTPGSSATASPAITTPATALGNAGVAVSGGTKFITATTTPSSDSDKSHSKSSTTPIVVGVVCSIVAISILSVLAWFFLRRRQQKTTKQRFDKSTAYEKEYDLARRSIDEPQGESRGGEGLETNGAYQKAPLTGRSRAFSETSMDIASNYDDDEPIPDDEKPDLPPPEQQHPAYHPLPGQSPGFPSFSPYLPSPISPDTPTTPTTPIHSQQQKQHPAYHVHQLSQHPAFRSPKSPPPPSNLQQEVTPPIDGFSFLTSTTSPKSKPTNKSPKPTAPSPELPASIPAAATSPPKRRESLLRRLNNTPSFHRGHRAGVIKRDNSSKTETGASTYSIPIGLGVAVDLPLNSPTAESLVSPGGESIASPVTGLASTQQIQRFVNPNTKFYVPPPPPIPSSPPRMAANMNSREDHVLSWASYSAGNLSGIGPNSKSKKSEKARKQRQREIELGIAPSASLARAELQGDVPVGENGTPPMNIEHEIMRWSELRTPGQGQGGSNPETPLSQVYRESWGGREDWASR